jgi:DNA-binding transcriptional ArsR family regulator
MSTSTLNPVIHNRERLRIAATLAALPPGDGLSFTRLRDMIDLTPARLSARLRELDQAGYIQLENEGGGIPIAAALTPGGRSALNRYAAALRQPPKPSRPVPAPTQRTSDADREAAAAALCEHFVQGRLSLEELHTRLNVALTATTYGDLTEAIRDLR